jgi:hypothetical protein
MSWVVIAHRYDRRPPMELYGPYEQHVEAKTAEASFRRHEAYEAAFALWMVAPNESPIWGEVVTRPG